MGATSSAKVGEAEGGGEAGHCKKCEVNNRTIEILVERAVFARYILNQPTAVMLFKLTILKSVLRRCYSNMCYDDDFKT